MTWAGLRLQTTPSLRWVCLRSALGVAIPATPSGGFFFNGPPITKLLLFAVHEVAESRWDVA